MADGNGTGTVVYVVKIEYEFGSDNGEVVCVLGVHRTEAGARAEADEWSRNHDCCDLPEDERGEWSTDDQGRETFVLLDDDGEESHYCRGCGWGADWTTAQLYEE